LEKAIEALLSSSKSYQPSSSTTASSTPTEPDRVATSEPTQETASTSKPKKAATNSKVTSGDAAAAVKKLASRVTDALSNDGELLDGLSSLSDSAASLASKYLNKQKKDKK
jgi:hypothetical protein